MAGLADDDDDDDGDQSGQVQVEKYSATVSLGGGGGGGRSSRELASKPRIDVATSVLFVTVQSSQKCW